MTTSATPMPIVTQERWSWKALETRSMISHASGEDEDEAGGHDGADLQGPEDGAERVLG